MSEVKVYKTAIVGAHQSKHLVFAEHRFEVVINDFSKIDQPNALGHGLDIILKTDHEAKISELTQANLRLVAALKEAKGSFIYYGSFVNKLIQPEVSESIDKINELFKELEIK